ncbi:hypothetical protein T492DRAFT_1108650 [Pavlovales sp. CCMP2436]|nr:hypothetical protein T492DRAFT_1108650 [Pavlovales sp. CCMP2436]
MVVEVMLVVNLYRMPQLPPLPPSDIYTRRGSLSKPLEYSTASCELELWAVSWSCKNSRAMPLHM